MVFKGQPFPLRDVGVFIVSLVGVGGGRLFRRESLFKYPPSLPLHNGDHEESRIRIASLALLFGGSIGFGRWGP